MLEIELIPQVEFYCSALNSVDIGKPMGYSIGYCSINHLKININLNYN